MEVSDTIVSKVGIYFFVCMYVCMYVCMHVSTCYGQNNAVRWVIIIFGL